MYQESDFQKEDRIDFFFTLSTPSSGQKNWLTGSSAA